MRNVIVFCFTVGLKPEEPTAVAAGTDSVDVNWKDPKQPRDKVEQFRIVAKSSDGGKEATKTVTPSETRPIKLTGLSVFKDYTVSIYTKNAPNSAGNGGGEGSPAETAVFKTWPAGIEKNIFDAIFLI